MAKFWYKRIGGDIERIDEVPELWREQVRAMCSAKHLRV